MATRNGIIAALGDEREGRLALWQVMARTLDQGSRLSATRLARQRETDFLRLGKFSENDLYKNLDWIAAHQQRIENLLYKKRYGNILEVPALKNIHLEIGYQDALSPNLHLAYRQHSIRNLFRISPHPQSENLLQHSTKCTKNYTKIQLQTALYM